MNLKKNIGVIIVVVIVTLLCVFAMLTEAGKEDNNSSGGNVEINLDALSSDMLAWHEATQKDKYVVTVIALSYCGYCKEYKPVIQEITDDENIPFYYFDIDTLNETAPEDANALQYAYDLENYTGSSPYTFITKNGEFIGDRVGAMDKETTISFLNSLGVVK